MNIEVPTDGRLELHSQNLERLRTLMGDTYNAMEMEDYMSYISPEDGRTEVDTLETKLNKGTVSKEDLIEKFKAHLGYLAA